MNNVSRRQSIKILTAVGASITVASFLPGKWLKPIVKVGVLPAHAQSSACPEYEVNTSDPSFILYIHATSPIEAFGMSASLVHFTPELPAGTMVSYDISINPAINPAGFRFFNNSLSGSTGAHPADSSGLVEFLEGHFRTVLPNPGDTLHFDYVFHIQGCEDVNYTYTTTVPD